jgi:hypothetical protein
MGISADTSRPRNEARRAPLSGRPRLQRYQSEDDVGGLLDKATYQKMYEEKWGGAPWLEASQENDDNSDNVIVLDHSLASSPCSSKTSSTPNSASSSPGSSRRTTQDE